MSTLAAAAACRYILVTLNLCSADILVLVLTIFACFTTVFNVGEYRRKAAPHSISCADFFRPDNKEAQEIREYDFAYC